MESAEKVKIHYLIILPEHQICDGVFKNFDWFDESQVDEIREPDPIFEAFEIYPTKIGWKLLEEKCKNIWQLLPQIFERNFSALSNKENNTFKLPYQRKDCNKLFAEFMYKTKYCYDLPKRIESSMEKYLKEHDMTYAEFESQARARAWDDGD